jgi:hypothetical protein
VNKSKTGLSPRGRTDRPSSNFSFAFIRCEPFGLGILPEPNIANRAAVSQFKFKETFSGSGVPKSSVARLISRVTSSCRTEADRDCAPVSQEFPVVVQSRSRKSAFKDQPIEYCDESMTNAFDEATERKQTRRHRRNSARLELHIQDG